MKRNLILFKILCICILSLGSIKTYTQISVTSYYVYAFGINTNKDKRISAELKSLLNNSKSDISIDVSGMYNFRKREYHQVSAGLGVNFESSIKNSKCIIPLQVDVFPFENLKRLSLVMEINSTIYKHTYIGVNIRHLLGIRYTFK